MSVNKVTLLGNVGQAPQFKEFEGGGCVALVSVATNKRGYKDKSGQEVPERTEWHNVVFYNNLAKTVNQYVKKGDKLYIEGELRTRSYDKDGGTRYVTEVVAYNMEMLTPKGDRTNVPPPPTEAAAGFEAPVQDDIF